MPRKKFSILRVSVAVLLVVVATWWALSCEIISVTEYSDPEDTGDLILQDDRPEDKHPVFDPELVDSRPIGDWLVNSSAALIALDCPPIKPDAEGWCLVLRPSYAKAAGAAEDMLLPSANMLDGVAKQFDDGLYAALDLACFRGEFGFCPALPDFVQAVLDELPDDAEARPFLGAALSLVGHDVQLSSKQQRQRDAYLREFERDGWRSKPIAFYNWTPELTQVWRFLKFLQCEFGERELAIPIELAGELGKRPDLLEQYRAINAFYGRLTNPLIAMPVDVLLDGQPDLPSLAAKYHSRRMTVAFFPPSTSRETELTDRVFPTGLPGNANVMTEFMRRIRSGEIDLAPQADDGWYTHQVHALETMLLPSRGRENEKLVLTARYKKRLIEAFQALMTKRRETHARQAATSLGVMLGEGEVRPRLRVEPCATFYLRTARAYAFLANFLAAAVDPERLASLHGLRKDGERPLALGEELRQLKQRFYGFYLVACEDIGMKPEFAADEEVDAPAAMQEALRWLEHLRGDPDLACDTRVCVPIYVDPPRSRTRLWATLGVRLVPLDASYAVGPKMRPADEPGDWQDAEWHQLGERTYYLPVDDFAEIEIEGLTPPTRDEFRAICDKYRTHEDIIRVLDCR